MIAIPTRRWANGSTAGKPRALSGGALVDAGARWRTNDLAFLSLTVAEPARDIDREICRLALLSFCGDETPPLQDRWM